MKEKYVNTYEYTDEMCRKVAGYVYYRRVLALVSHIVLAVVFALGLAFSVYYIVSGKEPEYHYSTYAFYAIAPVIAEAVIFAIYRKMLKKERELLKEEGGIITVTAQDDMLSESTEGEILVSKHLFDVEKVYSCKDFFLIIALSGEYFIFKRGSFTEGDESTFADCIRSRVKEIHKAAIENGKKQNKTTF